MESLSPRQTLSGPVPVNPGSAPPNIVSFVRTPAQARALPKGTLVGDEHGGLTFSSAVARVLEQRSTLGWTEYPPGSREPAWTLIYLDR